ncbi:hypothetical protein BD289DRAFT_285890 [Coniella lustricola]|uniref:Uncharacterized protein n=1 Tax=Coniella lustricola TaxID=2025994 RepID=A0A2T3AK59_9PEZI|nr:hypothetical protein BD289DRAFT_285890 [Coniella lustricola]
MRRLWAAAHVPWLATLAFFHPPRIPSYFFYKKKSIFERGVVVDIVKTRTERESKNTCYLKRLAEANRHPQRRHQLIPTIDSLGAESQLQITVHNTQSCYRGFVFSLHVRYVLPGVLSFLCTWYTSFSIPSLSRPPRFWYLATTSYLLCFLLLHLYLTTIQPRLARYPRPPLSSVCQAAPQLSTPSSETDIP